MYFLSVIDKLQDKLSLRALALAGLFDGWTFAVD
jgi:hypothetical protein